MKIARNKEELSALYKDVAVLNVKEEECFWWVEILKNGVVYMDKVYKPIPWNYVAMFMAERGFPPRILKDLKHLRETEIIQTVKSINGHKGIILSGPAGVGKTFALSLKIANKLRNYRVKNPVYISLPDLQDFKSTKELVAESDVVFLDDVKGSLRESLLDFVHTVIYHCYNHEKLLYIATNLSWKDLINVLQEQPIVSRLSEMCVYKRIEGKDLRLSRR
ncbi:hypothetical protein [Hydrogenobacter thermophilus]|uniref:hypothetical protein n=1 Tax=Hydrogenobacter thermophilus TaxID=940 RepID=UPI0030F52066